MNGPRFGSGVVIAALFACAAAAAFAALTLLWPGVFVIKLLIAVLSGAYLAVLVTCSRLRFGRLALAAAWLAAAALIAWFAPGLLSYLALHTAVLWLSRALLCHRSVLSALIDIALSIAALIAAIATARHSGSVALSVWSFFLVQALFVFIPREWQGRAQTDPEQSVSAFDRAHSRAEAALAQLSRTR